MKLCFMFADYSDANKVKQFLETLIPVKLDSYLGYNMLSAPKKDYKNVVTLGIKFIAENKIVTAWWIDKDGKRMPLDCIPLLFGEIPKFFKNRSLYRKVIRFFCRRYAKNYEKRLGQQILIHYTPNFNVEFRLARNDETLRNHKHYEEEITKYCLAHHHAFKFILVTDAYGNDLTMINQNRCVEWPTKTPR